MGHRNGAARQAGFTLLELLVGLVVLGFILAGLTQGVRFGLRASETQSRLVDGRSELDAVDRALRRLLVEADPGSSHDPPPMQGGPARLVFISTLPTAVLGQPGEEADVALAVDGEHRLVLRWSPHIHAKRVGPPPLPQEAELLRGVEGVDFAYWMNGWQPSWAGANLPVLIRIRIRFMPGDPRHWPEMVVSPLRQRFS